MPSFPAAIATDADLLVAIDSAVTTLAAGIGSGDTSLSVASALAIASNVVIAIDNELIRLGTVVGANATGCSRAFGGTTASAHLTGAAVNLNVIAAHHNASVDEIQAIQAAMGVGADNVLNSAIVTRVSQFTFSVATAVTLPAATLAVVTPATMPPGIVAAGANQHYVRIVDAVGGNEVVLLTAITGSTFSFTPALGHTSGNWTIQSATSGIQEAFYSEAPVDLDLGKGNFTLYGKLVLFGYGGNTVRIRGRGHIATRLVRHSSYPAGDLILYDAGLGQGHITMSDFSVLNANGFDNTSGAGIHLILGQPREAFLTDVTVLDGFNPIVIDGLGGSGVGTPILRSVYALISSAYHTLFTSGDAITMNAAGGDFLNVTSIVGTPGAGTTGSGLKITRSDGINVIGGFYSGKHGIKIENNPAYILNFINISGVIIDSTYSHGIYFPPGAHNAIYNQIRIVNSHFATQSGDPAGCGIYFGNDPEAVTVLGCTISGFLGSGIALGLTNVIPRSVVINANNINNNGQGGAGHGIVIPPTGSGGSGSYEAHTVIAGNVMGNNITGYGGPPQQAGIYFAGGAGKFRGYVIKGNDLRGNSVGPIVKDATPTMENIVINSNLGESDTYIAIPSASLSAADAAAFNRNIEVPGTTNVTSLTPAWDGREITLVKVDAGTVNFTTAGNFAATASMAQYETLNCKYYAALGKWLIK